MNLEQRLLVVHNEAGVTDAVVFGALAVLFVHRLLDVATVDVLVIVVFQ